MRAEGITAIDNLEDLMLAKKYFKERDFITIQFNFVQSRFNSTEQKVYSEVAQNGIKSLPSQTDGQLL